MDDIQRAELIKEHIEECRHRISVVNNFMATNKDADEDNCCRNIMRLKAAISAIEELQQYKDLERQGQLIKLPCKKGSVIWDNDFGRPCSYEVTDFSYGDLNEDCLYEDEEVFNTLMVHYSNINNGSVTGSFAASEFEKTVFPTREDAEKALEGMKHEQD